MKISVVGLINKQTSLTIGINTLQKTSLMAVEPAGWDLYIWRQTEDVYVKMVLNLTMILNHLMKHYSQNLEMWSK